MFRAAGLRKYPHVRCEIAFICQSYKEYFEFESNLSYTESRFNKHVLPENAIKNNMALYLWNNKSKSENGKFYGFCWEPITLITLLPVRCNTHSSSVTLLHCDGYNFAMKSEFQFRLCYRGVKQPKTT